MKSPGVSRRQGHLAILQVIARLRKQIVVAAVVVMQVADDDVLYRFGSDAESRKPVAHRLDHLTLALLAHRLVEADIDNDRAGRPDNHLDEKIERLQNVVRIAVNEISRRTARMVAVANGVNFMNIVGHRIPSFRASWPGRGHPATLTSRGPVVPALYALILAQHLRRGCPP